MLEPGKTYDEVYRFFRWTIPEYYNMGIDVCDKWVDGYDRLAVICEGERGKVEEYTFRDLKVLSDKLANTLQANGIRRNDRLGILLPQRVETVISHLATYKVGAVAVPLFTLFGVDALEYRLADSGAKGIITDGANVHKVLEIRARLPDLTTVIVADGGGETNVLGFWESIGKASTKFTAVSTKADDPALIIYTSGTTGPPKGALHAHRVLLGHLPGVEFPHNFFPRRDDVFWTPADWAWIGGLLDVLLPSLHHGIPVVAHRARKFDPEEAFHLIAKHRIRNAFMPPTALKLMRQVRDPRSRHDYRMRSIGSGGETLGAELLAWGKDAFDLTINEFYGQTEVNLVIANSSEIMEVKPGSMGKAVPGHIVEVIDERGDVAPTGVVGEIAVKRPDPVMFLEYWRNRPATEEKRTGDWCLTGDLARKDGDGYFWFIGRTDDIITSAGYRIGPSEIEDCLMKHPAVSAAAVVGSPDELRTEIVKAFIVLRPEMPATQGMEEQLKSFVKVKLAAHEYPREIEFVKELPLTATGKVMRRELRRVERERKLGRKGAARGNMHEA